MSANQISFVGLLIAGLKYYLQFKIQDKYWLYEFSERETATRIRYISITFSPGKALAQAKKKCQHQFTSGVNPWNGTTKLFKPGLISITK